MKLRIRFIALVAQIIDQSPKNDAKTEPKVVQNGSKSSKSGPKQRFRPFTGHKNRAKSVRSIIFALFGAGLPFQVRCRKAQAHEVSEAIEVHRAIVPKSANA